MDYFKEIKKKINEFCNNVPAKGFEINYLENAQEVLELYGQACAIVEEGKEENELQGIYEDIINLTEE